MAGELAPPSTRLSKFFDSLPPGAMRRADKGDITQGFARGSRQMQQLMRVPRSGEAQTYTVGSTVP